MKKRKTNKQSLYHNVEYGVQLAHPSPPPPSQLANPQYYNTDCSLLILRYLNLIFLLCRKHFNFSNQRFFPSCNAGDLESAPILVRKSDDSQQYDMEWHTAAACPLASKWGTRLQSVWRWYWWVLSNSGQRGQFCHGVMPWSRKAASYEPRIAILGIWGDTWLTCGKYGIYVAVRGSSGALTGLRDAFCHVKSALSTAVSPTSR